MADLSDGTAGKAARLRASMPRIVSGLALATVALVTGRVSYIHIHALTLALHQPPEVARLMPFGVDGLIVVGSVVLLNSADQKTGRLGWLGIGPGSLISLFANVESGIMWGPLAAAWAGVPAIAFTLSTFMFERWLKAQASGGQPGSRPQPSAPVREADTQTSAALVSPPSERRTRPAGQPHRRQAARPGRRTLADIEAMPGMPPADTVVSAIRGGHSTIRGLQGFLSADYPAVTKHMADQLVKAYSNNGFHSTEEK